MKLAEESYIEFIGLTSTPGHCLPWKQLPDNIQMAWLTIVRKHYKNGFKTALHQLGIITALQAPFVSPRS